MPAIHVRCRRSMFDVGDPCSMSAIHDGSFMACRDWVQHVISRCDPMVWSHGVISWCIFRVISFQKKIPAPELCQIRGCRLSSAEYSLGSPTFPETFYAPKTGLRDETSVGRTIDYPYIYRTTSVHGSPDKMLWAGRSSGFRIDLLAAPSHSFWNSGSERDGS